MSGQKQKVYRITKHEGIDNLHLKEETVEKPKRGQVLVKIEAVSLNYRDLIVAKGIYPPPYAKDLIPCSDGAGYVVEVGEDVNEWKVNDRVAGIFNQGWLAGEITEESFATCLGGSIHGVLQQYRVFDQTGLVRVPDYLSYEEAATLPCAAVTAWNALTAGKHSLGPHHSIVAQGTGGVSVFGAQLGVAAGARVFGTSSSNEKLQASHIKIGAKKEDCINYKETPEWGKRVKELTNGRGVDFVLEVGGGATIQNSLACVRKSGEIPIIGFVGGVQASLDVVQVHQSTAFLRGIYVGSRQDFIAMLRAMEHQQIHPIIDKVFPFKDALEAYRYQESQKHVGKVVIKVD